MTEAAPTRRLRPSRPTPSTHLSPHSSQPSALPSPPLSTARHTSPGLVSGSSAVGAGRPGGYSTFSSSGSGETSMAGSSAREKDHDRNRDVFGDVGASPALGRAASPSVKGALVGASRTMPSPVSMGRSGGKGKGAVRDYGDRFIPNRDGTDLHAAYKLLPDPVAGGAGGRRRKSNVGQASDVEARKEEDNVMFSQLLRSELLSPRSPSRTASPSHPPPRASPSRHAQLRRPIAASYGASHVSHQSSRYPSSSAGTTPLHHYPPPATSGIGSGSGIAEGSGRERELSPASTLPPLPLHAPSTPNSSRTHGIDGLYGAGPSSAGHRAHQSQVALSGPGHRASPGAPASPPDSGLGGVGADVGVGGSGNGYARRHTRTDSFDHTKLPLSPPSHHADEPGTPSKKRLLNFVKSPGSNRMAALTNGYGYGYGLDNMEHERYSTSPVGKRSQEVLLSPRKGVRSIGRTPFKVLDAPELADDFYLNLVSWSSSNVLAVGLSSCVYLWSAQTSKVTKLCDMAGLSGTGEEVNDAVTGLDWTNRGSTIAIGTSRGTVEIWDAEHCKKLRTMTGHSARVGSLAWNNHILSTGSRDRTILHRDVRVPDHYIRKLSGHHKQEVCGLKWNTQTDQLASGGNDNKLYIWSATDSRPTWKFGEHRAAVKAIAWSPHQRGVLASGGGTADKKIRFWNSMTGGLVSEWDTGSQVCNLMYSLNSNELVSTHGYSGGPISNQIHIWRYPSMTQVATLTGHTYRVLYLAMSPDGQTIVTGAGDETLRFWNAFPKAPGKKSVAGGGEGVGAGSGTGAGGDGNPFVQLR